MRSISEMKIDITVFILGDQINVLEVSRLVVLGYNNPWGSFNTLKSESLALLVVVGVSFN